MPFHLTQKLYNERFVGVNKLRALTSEKNVLYRGIHEKGSGDVVSAVIYTIYLSLSTQTAETTSPESFCEILYKNVTLREDTNKKSVVLKWSDH